MPGLRPAGRAPGRVRALLLRHWWTAALAGGLLFAGLGAIALPHAASLPNVGTRYVRPSMLLPGQHPVPGNGYDGQFSQVLAEDPFLRGPDTARSLDNSFRVRRLLYPLLAWALSLGQRGVLAYALLAINVAAGAALAVVLARAAARRGRGPWLAFAALAYPGVWLPLFQDTVEPLQSLLLVLGVEAGSLGLLLAAALAKETAATALVTEAARSWTAGDRARAARAAATAAAYVAFALVVHLAVRGPAFNTLGAHFLDPPGAPALVLLRGGPNAVLALPAVLVAAVAAVRPLLGARDAASLAACAYALLTLGAGLDTWTDPAAYYRVTAGAAVLLYLSWLSRRDRAATAALVVGAAAGAALLPTLLT